MKRPDAAQHYLCPACAREWIEVGPWAFGAVCKAPNEHADVIRSFGSYGGASKLASVVLGLAATASDDEDRPGEMRQG